MTKEQEAEFRKQGIYKDIILMTNLTMIYSYIMYFALQEATVFLGKKYCHAIKYYYNKVLNLLDQINCSNLNCFKTGQSNAGQMCIDISTEIEDRLNFEDKHLYILFVVNQKIYDNIHRFEPTIQSIFKTQIEYIYKTLIEHNPITLDSDKMRITTIVINQIVNRIKAKEKEDGSLAIIYNDAK